LRFPGDGKDKRRKSGNMGGELKILIRVWTAVLPGVLVLSVACRSGGTVEVETGDRLVLQLGGQGAITGLSVDERELLPPGKTGGFLLGEYRLDPGPELVSGGGFEGEGGFRVSGGWHRDSTVAHSGKGSLCLDVSRKGEFLVEIPLKPEATYLVSFFMKAEGLDGDPILHIRRKDRSGRLIGRQANIEHLGVYRSGWTLVRHTFQTLPGTERGELMFHVTRGNLRGKLWIDDFSVRELRLPRLVEMKGVVKPDSGGVVLRAEQDGIKLETTFRGRPDHVYVRGILQDTTGRDRSVQLVFRLPVNAAGWTWQTGLDTGEPIEQGRTYTNAIEIGRDTNRYISPWPYSSIDGPEAGLSLGVPVNNPSVYRMWYTADGYYAVRFDLGLTRDTKKFPGKAEFALVVYRHDPAWGMRAAAKRYFSLFSRFFEARTKPGATFQNQLLAKIRGLEDFGAMYGDRHGGDVSWIKLADDTGMYSMTYNEPWMWRSYFGRLSREDLPTAEGIVDRERRDLDAWDRDDSPAYPHVPRAYSVRAFLNSVFHDEFDRPVMNGTRTYSGGRYRVVEWLTNSDPEITGPYGRPNRGLLSWVYEYGRDRDGAAELGGKADGIRYDSLTEWTHLGAENFRREHFAFADFPLTFSYKAARPCQLGYFCALEYMSFVRREVLRQDGITYGNGGVGVPWFCWLLDGISREGWHPDMEGYRRIRMLMYHKTCGDWGGGRINSLSNRAMAKRLNTCLTYAWWPGIAGAPQRVFDRKRPVFKKYIPVLKALALAGWEPVTYARVLPGGTVIERFGGGKGRPLYFTVRNTKRGPVRVKVTLDYRALGIDLGTVRIRDVLGSGKPVPVKKDGKGTLYLSLGIPGRTTVVLGVERDRSR